MQDNNKNIPIFAFQQCNDFQIQGNFFHLIITIRNNYINEMNTILQSIFTLLKKQKLKFIGVNYICQESKSVLVSHFKTNHFNNFKNIIKDDMVLLM